MELNRIHQAKLQTKRFIPLINRRSELQWGAEPDFSFTDDWGGRVFKDVFHWFCRNTAVAFYKVNSISVCREFLWIVFVCECRCNVTDSASESPLEVCVKPIHCLIHATLQSVADVIGLRHYIQICRYIKRRNLYVCSYKMYITATF